MLWGYCFFFLILSTLIIVFRRPILLRVILLKTHFFLFRCLLNMLKKSFFEVDASTTGEEIISFSYFLFKVSFTSLNIDWGLLLVLVPNFFSLLIWLVRRGEDLFLFFFFSFFFFPYFFLLFLCYEHPPHQNKCIKSPFVVRDSPSKVQHSFHPRIEPHYTLVHPLKTLQSVWKS